MLPWGGEKTPKRGGRKSEPSKKEKQAPLNTTKPRGRFHLSVFFVLVVLIAPCLASGKDVKLGKKVPPLKLKDSKGKTYTLASFKEPVLAIWYEGKNSKEQNRWLKKKLKKMFDKNIIPQKKFRSVGIANFQETAVPNFIVNAVIKKESKETGAIILCDRKGKMIKKWGFRNGRSNIYILDKNRRLRWKSSGKLSKRRGKQLIRFILRLTR